MSQKTKETPFSDEELRILLNFINDNKDLLLNTSNKHAISSAKTKKWNELSAKLSSKGTLRKMQSVAQKWKNLKDLAKVEWHRANGKVKPTGGGKSYAFDWKSLFIIETIGVEFHAPSVIAGGIDSSSVSNVSENSDVPNSVKYDDDCDYRPNNPSPDLSFTGDGSDSFNDSSPIATASPSPTPSSSFSSSRKRAKVNVDHDSEMNKYNRVLEYELENQRLMHYKLLLEIGLLREKRKRLGLPEEPEPIELNLQTL